MKNISGVVKEKEALIATKQREISMLQADLQAIARVIPMLLEPNEPSPIKPVMTTLP